MPASKSHPADLTSDEAAIFVNGVKRLVEEAEQDPDVGPFFRAVVKGDRAGWRAPLKRLAIRVVCAVIGEED